MKQTDNPQAEEIAPIEDSVESGEAFIIPVPLTEEAALLVYELEAKIRREMNDIFTPMEKLLAKTTLYLDLTSILLRPTEDHSGENYQCLRSFLKEHEDQSFSCEDVHLLFEDCTNFVLIVDEYLPVLNTGGLVDYVNTLKPFSKVFAQQLVTLRRWAELTQAPARLRDLLR